ASERQFPDLRDVEHMRSVVIRHHAIHVEVLERLDEIRTAVGIDLEADYLGPGVARLYLQAFIEAPLERGLQRIVVCGPERRHQRGGCRSSELRIEGAAQVAQSDDLPAIDIEVAKLADR